MADQIKEQFQQRFENFEAENKVLKQRSNQYAWIRVIFFFVCLAGIVFMANEKISVGILIMLIILLVGFFVLLKKHQQVKKAQLFNQAMARINS